MIIPIGHDKARRRLPIVTLALIVLCTLVQLERLVAAPSPEQLYGLVEQHHALVVAMVDELEQAGAPVDFEAINRRDYAGIEHPYVASIERLERRIVTLARQDVVVRWGWSPAQGWDVNLLLSLFVHAGWLHLVGNMLFLWLAGSAIEDRWGHLPFALFYLVGGAVAAFAYGRWNHGSSVPIVGASGAVAACMGAFLIVYARVRIRFAYWFYFRRGILEARALYALPIWFLEELAYSYLEARGQGGGVAHSAHVGGFVFGMLVAAALKYGGVEQKHLMLLDEVAEDWQHANPEIEDALRYERAGQKSAALASFRLVLGREPTHAVARAHALPLALDLGEVELARRLADAELLELVHASRGAEVAALFEKLRGAGVHTTLPERTLAEVARACLGVADGVALGVQIVRQLLDASPASALLPGLVWRVAEAQTQAGRPDLAERALHLLVERFPMDPFADRARTKLRA